MHGHDVGLPPVEATAVVSDLERDLAVAQWLLGAADDREAARTHWRERDVALLACGGIFSAVRAPAHLVWAAAGTKELKAVDDHLRRWFDGGAVFVDLHSHLYYFLVPGCTAWTLTQRECPGVDILGRNHFLGVPSVGLQEPRGRSYWCVPMSGPGDLCYPDEVEELFKEGRAAREGGDR